MMKRAALLALVLAPNPILDAQVADKVVAEQPVRQANTGITQMSGGVTLAVENVQITADEAEYDQNTGEIAFQGTVLLRQRLRPAMQSVPATNLAGASFPAPKEVVIRMRGGLQIEIGDLRVRAAEADVNGLTGEMTLRGDVRVMQTAK